MKESKSIILKILLATVVLVNSNLVTFASGPAIDGEVAITMDVNTKEIIYAKNAEEPHALASTTKLLTSLLFAENKNKNDLIPYSEYSCSLEETTLNGNFMGGTVVAGDTMTADDIMKSVMIFSANDSSILMAESVAGSVDKFVELMNQKAKELGAVNSNFINPNGLELENGTYNITTAYDLALIGIAAYENEWIRDTMSIQETSVTLKGLPIYIETRNKVLGKDGNIAGKTGTETNAGHCFVGFYNRDGRELVTVVLGANYGADGTIVFDDTESIANFSYSEVKDVVKFNKDEIATLDLEYKMFIFFGPTKRISSKVTLNEDVIGYDNSFIDNNENFSIDENNIGSAWDLAKNNIITVKYNYGVYECEYEATVDISKDTLINANLPIYVVCGILLSFFVIFAIIIILKIRKSKRRKG